MMIWTKTARDLLFEELVRQFGPLSKWERKSTPGNGKDKAFKQFLTSFADMVGAKSDLAVLHQVRFASPIKGETSWNGGFARSAILCMASAINAGFIGDGDLPDLIARPR